MVVLLKRVGSRHPAFLPAQPLHEAPVLVRCPRALPHLVYVSAVVRSFLELREGLWVAGVDTVGGLTDSIEEF